MCLLVRLPEVVTSFAEILLDFLICWNMCYRAEVLDAWDRGPLAGKVSVKFVLHRP